MNARRVIVIEVPIPGGDPDYTHFLQNAGPWDVLMHGLVVNDSLENTEPEFTADRYISTQEDGQ